MKKRFLFFILLIICASLFVGCFDMGEISDYISDDDEKTEETEVSYTVHLWVSEEDGTQTYKTSGEELKNLPTFSRAGYTFKGIYDAKEGGSLYIKADGTATQLIYKDIDLYCQWEAKTYTISYTSDIGRVSEKSVEAKAGQVLIFQTPLYNENQYSFLGWYYGDTQVSTATNWKDGFETLGEKYGELSSTELTLTARFGPAQLKVIFDYNDGSYQTVEYNATYGQMFNFEYPTPTGINTEVIYWSEEQNGTTVYSADYITGTLTLYAIWNDYKEVKFYTDDTNFLEKKYYKGEDIEVENPTREGYDFDGWYTSQNYFGNPIESFSYGMLSKIYYAKWTPVVYNLTYSDGELAGSVITYTVEDEFTLQSMPEKEGYTFTGWKDETGRIHTKKEIGKTIGTLLSAVYTPNTYTITYKDGENTVGTLSTKYNEAYELKAPDKKGYSFVKFTYDGKDFTSGTYTFAKDIVIDITYEIIHYDIIYHLDDGENNEENPLTYTILEEVTFKMPTKANYIFEGWYCEDAFETIVEKIEKGSIGEKHIYAKFKGESKASILNAMGGSCQKEKMIVQYGSSYTLPVCTKVDYSFIGWYNSDGEDATALTDEKGNSLAPWEFSSLNTVVYAKYIPRYYVTLKLSHPGAADIELEEYYLAGDTVIIDFTYDDGYTFSGFYDKDGIVIGYSTKYSFKMPNENVLLQLKFEPSYFTLTFDTPEDAYCLATSQDVEYGAEYTLPLAYVDGKKFVGWKLGEDFITDENGNSLSAYMLKQANTITPVFEETTNGAVLIRNADDFLKIEKSGNYVLLSNINLSGKAWTPIDFSGHIEGLEHKITGLTTNLFNTFNGYASNLTISCAIEEENIEASEKKSAVFALTVSGGSIDNVTIEGSISLKGKYSFGGLANTFSNGTITNCNSKATITVDDNGDAYAVGGLIAYMTGGTIKNSTFRGNLTGGWRVGGLIGYISGGTYRELTNYGTITGNERVGGVVGWIEYSGNVTIENLYLTNEGTVTGQNCVGGVVGYLYGAHSSWNNSYTLKISHLYNKGIVSGNNQVGGVVGRVYCYNSDSGCFYGYLSELHNTGSVSGNFYVGGVLGYFISDTRESYINASSSKNTTVTAKAYVGGLFGKVENPQIDNCSNEGMTITCQEYNLNGSTHEAYYGGIAGYACYVYNCTNNVNLTYESDGRYVGGIAGYSTGRASGCVNNGIISAPNAEYVGGIYGRLCDGGNYTFDKNENTGAIFGNTHVGGIVGELYNYTSSWNTSYTLNISQLVNSGVITATGDYVGGIFGYLYGYNVDDGCTYVNVLELHNTANVTGKSHVGGLIGYSISDTESSYIKSSDSKNCVVTAEYMVGGLAGKLENLYIDSCSNEGMTIQCTSYSLDGTNHNAYFGGYAGYASSIFNCTNTVSLNYESDGRFVGGLAGYSTGRASGCTNNGVINAPNSEYVGGIFGRCNRGGTYTFENCTNTASITGKIRVGGICGEFYNYTSSWNNSYTLSINQLTNSGDITGSDAYVGGIFGYLYGYNADSGNTYVNVLEIHNTGDVTGKNLVGGLIGYAISDTSSSYIKSSDSKNCAVTAEYLVGGLAGKLENVYMDTCSNEGMIIRCTSYVLDGTNHNAYFGGYVGLSNAVYNCTNGSNLVYESDGRFVGGISGHATGRASGNTNNGTISAPNSDYVGGIFGYCTASGTYTFETCTNTANITGKSYVGGICGQLSNNTSAWNTAYTLTINQLTNSGNITGSGSYVGGIFGHLYGNNSDSSTLSCNVLLANNTGNVTGDNRVGGLAGYAWTENTASFQTCSSKNCTVTGNYYVGGLIGEGKNASLTNCSNEGMTVTANGYLLDGSTMYAYFGGYAGYIVAMENCENAVAITYTTLGRYVGGFAGYSTGNLISCKNTANVTALNSSYVGGLCGFSSVGGRTIRGCENSGNISGGDNYVGGLIGEMKNTVSDWKNSYYFTFETSTNSGSVNGEKYVGGLVGHFYVYNSDSGNFYVTINAVTNSGAITGTDMVGGLFGEFWAEGNSNMNLSSNTGTITAETNYGEIFGKQTNLTINES